MTLCATDSHPAYDELGSFPLSDRGWFIRRMRIHQAWWRQERLGHSAWGEHREGPPYASFLPPEAVERGANFLTAEIRAVVKKTPSGKVQKSRNEANLLSSQPMAFNLFGPLAARPKLARRLLDPILPGGVSAARVVIEYTPNKKTHLNDGTSLDVFVHYRDRAGSRRMMAIETKLTESFSPATSHNNPDRDTYRNLTKEFGLWRADRKADLPQSKCWQLWRNHLLIEKIRHVRNDRNAADRVVSTMLWVIRHDLDERCRSSLDAYCRCLKSHQDVFRADTLSDLTDIWVDLVEGADRQWLDDFKDRYLHLHLSDGFAQHLRKSKARSSGDDIVKALCRPGASGG